MKNTFTRLVVIAALFAGGITPLCALTWAPGWTVPPARSPRTVTPAELTEARRLGDAADSAASVRTAIQAWEKIAAAQPDDPGGWIELATLRLLEGAAYRRRAKDRLPCYLAALQDCERAMATNPEFLRRVRQGQKPWVAAAALGPREMGAMNFWVTGVFYVFRDCLGLFGRITSVRLFQGTKPMLQRMDAIDPAWEEYTSTFSWGIYYLALPASRGGDRVRAREYFDLAVVRGGHRTLPRWGRGKYFYKQTGETAAARADLAAVAVRDLDELAGSRSWNRYFKLEAAALLGK
jgi:hypothetical protein